MIEKMRTLKWRLVPICLLFALLPLIMRLIYFKVDPIYSNCLYDAAYPDWFFFFKGIVFIFLTIGMLIFLVVLRKQIEPHRDLYFKIYSICGLIFIIGTMLSTFLSPYKDFAIIGGPTRFEGLGVILCYVMTMFYCYSIFEKTNDFKYLIIPFIVIISIQTFVGLTQFLGYDMIQWKGIRDIIAPGEFETLNYYAPGTEPWFPKTSKQWTATLGNSNYSGSFVALAVPFFLAITLSTAKFKLRLGYWFITFCGVFMAFACRSRSGLVGIILSLVIGVICLIRFYPDNKKNIKWVELGLALVITLCLMFITNADNRFSTLFADIHGFLNRTPVTMVTTTQIEDIQLDPFKILLKTNQGTLTASFKDNTISFTDSNLTPIEDSEINGNLYTITTEPYTGYAFEKFTIADHTYINFFEDLNLEDLSSSPKCGFTMNQDGIVTLINPLTFEKLTIETPPSIGFEGKERLGSGRGYIWSRSIPLLKDTMLLGYGPDMYMLEFPQQDFWGKWKGLGNPFICVDKPHNTYLQIWINQGFPAFLAFIILCSTYMIHCLKLYAFKKQYTYYEGLGLAFMLAIIGYLGASFFNDTTLSVTPLFWALLGAGMAYNVTYTKGIQQEDQKASAT